MLITADDLADYLGETNTDAFETKANIIIPAAQGSVQRYCNLVQLEEIEDDVITMAGSYSAAITLPRGPVSSVSAITIDGFAVSDWDLVEDTLIRTGMDDQISSINRPRGLHWGGPDVIVAVTYTHGLSTPPPEVLGVIYDIATRAWANPVGVRSQSIEGMQ